jgi:RNA polymerase sigma-70 factor (ECF subfamily)
MLIQQMKQRAETPETPSDLELVRLAASGEVGAFHQLVDRHAKRLFRMAQAMSCSRCDAEDLLQETLVGAFRNLGRFAGRSSVKTWLTSILMKQAAKGWHRSRHVRGTLSIESAGQEKSRDDEALVVGSPTITADQRMDIAAMLEELPPHYREVLILREVQQMSYDEMAQALGVPRGTIESRVHRARQQLRARLGAYEAPRDRTDSDQAADAQPGAPVEPQ